MEENTGIWNKKASDLTVKETVLLTAATPIIMIAGGAAASLVTVAGKSVVNKFRSRKNDQTNLND